MFQRDMVAIGSSTGGIDALRQVVAKLPAELPAAVLIVQHLAADSPGYLAHILNEAGPLPAGFGNDGEIIERNRIYVAPPDRHMLTDLDGVIRLTRGPRENRARPAVDPLFRSLALAFGPRVIGVVLTGNLDDGASGLKAIQGAGGICIVQEPTEAEAPGMPRSALQAVPAAQRVEIAKLADLIETLVGTAAEEEPRMAEDAMRKLKLETRIAEGDDDALSATGVLGLPSRLTCPECGGALSEISDAAMHRFRCHTGHAFSADALLASIREATDDSLWRAIRALQEEAIASCEMASQIKTWGEAAQATALEEEAARAKAAADQIRNIVQHGRGS